MGIKMPICLRPFNTARASNYGWDSHPPCAGEEMVDVNNVRGRRLVRVRILYGSLLVPAWTFLWQELHKSTRLLKILLSEFLSIWWTWPNELREIIGSKAPGSISKSFCVKSKCMIESILFSKLSLSMYNRLWPVKWLPWRLPQWIQVLAVTSFLWVLL